MKAGIFCFIHFFVLLSRAVPGMEQMLSKCLLNELNERMNEQMCDGDVCTSLTKRDCRTKYLVIL